ncbi:MAG: hypothetical protein AAFR61_11925 [Bacteroidota bacterium]
MNATPRLLNQLLVRRYYRENTLFFAIVLSLGVLVFRPPTLLFSPVFILPMFEDARFFLIILSLLVAYQLKVWRETRRKFIWEATQFLTELGRLSSRSLVWVLLRPLSRLLAPAWMYGITVSAYAVGQGEGHGLIILGVCLALLAAMMGDFTRLIRYPQERQKGGAGARWIEKTAARSLAYLSGMSVWTRFRWTLVFALGLHALVWALTQASHGVDPWPYKGVAIMGWGLACLMTILAYWVRRSADRGMFFLRNSPLPAWIWWRNDLVLGALLHLPALILGVSFGGRPASLDLLLGTYFMHWGLWQLSMGTLYYRPYALPQFLRLGLVAFLVGFMAILYGMPPWVLGFVSMLYGTWIYFSEFYAWDGWKD